MSDFQNFKSHSMDPFSFKPGRLLTSSNDQYTLNAEPNISVLNLEIYLKEET
jgi:hypothetical protein